MSRSLSLLMAPAPIEDSEGGNPFLTSPPHPKSTSNDLILLSPHSSTGNQDEMEIDEPVLSNPSLSTSSSTTTTLASPLTTPSQKQRIVSPALPLFSPPTPSRTIVSTPTPSSSTPAKRVWAKPVRGEEEGNPFLESSRGGEGSLFGAGNGMGSGKRKDVGRFEEKMTVDYVFRGQKKTFANPYYKPHPNLVPSTSHSMEDSPPRPKLLWPSVGGGSQQSCDVDMDEEEDDAPMLGLALGGRKHAREEEGRDGDGGGVGGGRKRVRIEGGMRF